MDIREVHTRGVVVLDTVRVVDSREEGRTRMGPQIGTNLTSRTHRGGNREDTAGLGQ